MLPNFVLMTLPGESGVEFVEILPFTPGNRNNLIGWIAGRSDADKYGTLVAYSFSKDKTVDGPLQIEARIDQNPQLSAQFSLWNQQGSRVVRGSLLVIPMGRGLLYAEPIYLQAERSPMPSFASSSLRHRTASPTVRHSRPRSPDCLDSRRPRPRPRSRHRAGRQHETLRHLPPRRPTRPRSSAPPPKISPSTSASRRMENSARPVSV